MKIKKLFAAGMGAAMALSMVACGNSGTASSDSSKKEFNIGIIQLVQHPALDAATEGFQDALNDLAGDDVQFNFDVQNASGETANCPTIVNGFVSDNVDLIMANATPALQAATASTKDIPILGTSITDYGTALEIKDWNGTVGGNVSGTSDLAPLDEQAAAIKELFPDAKQVGILYCSAEANSKYQADTITTYLEDEGFKVKQYTFSETSQIQAVTEDACDNSDVLYIPTDNTCANAASTVANVLKDKKVPAFVGEEGICSGCGVATLSISYYDLGYKTGEMAAQILLSGEDISQMPIEFAPNVQKKYNKEMADFFGIAIPEEYEAIEAE